MKKQCFCILAASFAGALTSFANLNLSTGVATWQYDTTGWGGNGGTGPASVVTPSDADWFYGWVANDSSSSWIAANPASQAYNNGIYTTSFNLSGYVLSTVSLTGSWTIDDAGTIYLNGNSLGTLSSGSWVSLTSLGTIPNSDFVSGENTLSIVGGATDNYLEGVRFDGSVTGGASAVPEASTFIAGAMMLLPFGLQGARMLRNRKQNV